MTAAQRAEVTSNSTGDLVTNIQERAIERLRQRGAPSKPSLTKEKARNLNSVNDAEMDEAHLTFENETVIHVVAQMESPELSSIPLASSSTPDVTEDASSLTVPALTASTSHQPLLGVIGAVLVISSSHETNTPSININTPLQAIGIFAKDNTVTRPKISNNFAYRGKTPTQADYEAAGIQGVIQGKNLEAINDVLASSSITDKSIDTVEKLQALVNAYNAVIDSTGNRLAASAALNANSFQLLGIASVDATNLIEIRNSIAAQTNASHIDSLVELQALVDFYNTTQPTVQLTTNHSNNFTNSNALNISAPVAGATMYYSVGNNAFSTTYDAPTDQGFHSVRVRQVSLQEGYLGKIASISFTYDTIAPSDVDLLGHIDGIQATDTLYVRKGGVQLTDGATGQAAALAPRISASADKDIYRIEVRVTGSANTEDRLISSGFVFPLNTNLAKDTNKVIGGVQGVDYNYDGSNKVLSISKTNGTAFTGAEIQGVEKDLRFISASTDEGDRHFTFSHLDGAGNRSKSAEVTAKFDNTPPQTPDLIDGNGNQIDDAEVSFFNATHRGTGKLVVPNIARTSDSDITTITIKIAGQGGDAANDQIVFGDVTQNLHNFEEGDEFSLGALTGLSWKYADHLLTFTKTSGAVFTADEVLTLEKALLFKTTSEIQGDRSFTFKYMDRATNFSSGATKTITVDTLKPIATSEDTTNGLLVSSNEAGAAYLLKVDLSFTDLFGTPSLADNLWNKIDITSTQSNTLLSTAGLDTNASYKLYIVDKAGNLADHTHTVVL